MTESNRQLVLRKSIGPCSAGTWVVPLNHDTSVPDSGTVVIATVDAGASNFMAEVDVTDLVFRRNRIDTVPAVARIDRDDRRAKRVLYELMKGTQ